MGDVSGAGGVATIGTNVPAPVPAAPAPGEPAPAAPVPAAPADPKPIDANVPAPGTVDTGRFGDWRDQMHEDIRGNDAFKEMKSPDELGHAYLDKLDGFVRMPGDDATDEEVSQFYKDMGVPDDMQAYVDAYQEVKLPEGIEADEQFVTDAMNEAFDLHMYPFQLQGLLDWYYTRMGDQQKSIRDEQLRSKDDAINQLKRDWGANYRQNSAIVERALNALGGDKVIDWAESVGIADDPTFLRLMHGIGKNLTEDMVLQGVPSRAGGGEKQTHLTYSSTNAKGGL